MSIALTLATAAAEQGGHGSVAAETVVFGLIALGAFALLGLVTFSYHNVANRRPAAKGGSAHGEHGAGHGH